MPNAASMATARRLFIERSAPAPTGVHSSPQQTAAWAAETFLLAPEEQHYARDVLRLAEGDEVCVADGHGYTTRATLKNTAKKSLCAVTFGPFTLSASLKNAPNITLAIPMPKGERADWMAEKLAELAVYAWVWVVCERSVVLPKKDNKHARLMRLMRAAARQARHGRVPKLLGPMPLSDHLAAVCEGPPCARFVADPSGMGAGSAVASARSMQRQLLVGPEGGLTDDELRAAQAAGYGRFTLGPHILRMETAAIACALRMGQQSEKD